MITTLLVPPVVMRPSVSSSESSRTKGHDDLTQKLQDIVKANNNVHDLLTHNRSADRAIETLAAHLVQYLTNDARAHTRLPSMGRAAARAANLRSVAARLAGGKKGRIRGSLCGKRVDFSSRSVIGPDAYIDIGRTWSARVHCVAPQTRATQVTTFNRARLVSSVRAGFGVREGAGSVVDVTGRKRCLERLSAEDRAQIADALEVGLDGEPSPGGRRRSDLQPPTVAGT